MNWDVECENNYSFFVMFSCILFFTIGFVGAVSAVTYTHDDLDRCAIEVEYWANQSISIYDKDKQTSNDLFFQGLTYSGEGHWEPSFCVCQTISVRLSVLKSKNLYECRNTISISQDGFWGLYVLP